MKKTEEKPKPKGKKVESFYDHKSGLECDIYLVGTEFVADLLERKFRADNVSLLRRQISDFAEHWLKMDWFPIIEVSISDRWSDDKASLSFSHSRYYLSRSPGGEVFKVDWETDERHRKANMECIGNSGYGHRRERSHERLKVVGLPLGAPLKNSEGEWLLDYDELLWGKFQHISDSITSLQKKLKELVSTKHGIAMLLEHGATLQLQDAKPINHRRR